MTSSCITQLQVTTLTAHQQQLWRARTAHYVAAGMSQADAETESLAELICTGRLYGVDHEPKTILWNAEARARATEAEKWNSAARARAVAKVNHLKTAEREKEQPAVEAADKEPNPNILRFKPRNGR